MLIFTVWNLYIDIMKPWELVVVLGQTKEPEIILASLDFNDPDVSAFYLGASYAIDPFVGIILHLPIEYDPRKYRGGIDVKTFDKLVKSIIDGTLAGDNLSRAVTALSHYCNEEEWLLWYKPILQGKMNIPISLEIFNQFCPDDCRIPPPSLSKPKAISSMDFPQHFFLQPYYPDERVFWTIDSTHASVEVFCYDSQVRRVQNVAEEAIISFAQSRPMNVVLFGYMTKHGFLADDILTKEQFTRESGALPLHRRLMGLAKLELPSVQMSSLLSPQKTDLFFQELDLILQQGYEGVIMRDLNAHYPFRVQSDVLIKPSIKGMVTCKEIIPDVGIRTETTRGKKVVESIVRLGLTGSFWKDISESSPVGRRLDVLSCGQKDTELLLPVFKQWR